MLKTESLFLKDILSKIGKKKEVAASAEKGEASGGADGAAVAETVAAESSTQASSASSANTEGEK